MVQVGESFPRQPTQKAQVRKEKLPDGRSCLVKIDTGQILTIFEPVVVCECDANGLILAVHRLNFSKAYHIENNPMPIGLEPGCTGHIVTDEPYFKVHPHESLIGTPWPLG